MLMAVADNRLLTFRFVLNNFINVLRPIILDSGAWTKDLPWHLCLFNWWKCRNTLSSPHLTAPQHFQRHIHGGLNIGEVTVSIHKKRGIENLIFDNERKFSRWNQFPLITQTALPASSIMVSSVPIDNVVIMLKKAFFFG